MSFSMEGRTAVVFGVANKRSIAWGIAQGLHAAGAKLFVKQIGSNHALWPTVTGKGEDPAQWPADLRVQDFPQ